MEMTCTPSYYNRISNRTKAKNIHSTEIKLHIYDKQGCLVFYLKTILSSNAIKQFVNS